jgi:hypothetical protein
MLQFRSTTQHIENQCLRCGGACQYLKHQQMTCRGHPEAHEVQNVTSQGDLTAPEVSVPYSMLIVGFSRGDLQLLKYQNVRIIGASHHFQYDTWYDGYPATPKYQNVTFLGHLTAPVVPVSLISEFHASSEVTKRHNSGALHSTWSTSVQHDGVPFGTWSIKTSQFRSSHATWSTSRSHCRVPCSTWSTKMSQFLYVTPQALHNQYYRWQ